MDWAQTMTSAQKRKACIYMLKVCAKDYLMKKFDDLLPKEDFADYEMIPSYAQWIQLFKEKKRIEALLPIK